LDISALHHFATFAREGVQGVFVLNGFFLFGQSNRLAELAARYKTPTSGELRVFAEAGGLMSYGADESEVLRHAGRYAGRILKGEKPADLPVLLPTKFELVIKHSTGALSVPSGAKRRMKNRILREPPQFGAKTCAPVSAGCQCWNVPPTAA
jgi:ABC transporter substrate binding protein